MGSGADMGTRWAGAVAAALAVLLAACAAPRHEVVINTPTTARPQPAASSGARSSGGIYHGSGYRPLFEDSRPRYVGDVLTITINERLNASQSANSSTDRSAELDLRFSSANRLFGSAINPVAVTGASSSTFDGKGSTSSSNLFSGVITVTVIDVLPNGNLVVAGEKQIGLRRNSEVLKFTGVINPSQILPGNVISSTLVADARLDYRGGGYIEEAQIKGWLTRFFDSWSPF